MIISNCLFCRVRDGVSDERIRSSISNSGTCELVVLDGKNCLVKLKNQSQLTQLNSIIKKLQNNLLFSSVDFSGSAFVSEKFL